MSINHLVYAVIIACLSLPLQAQDHGFDFGKITYGDLDMTTYDRDTSAVAVVLNEFGEAFFDSEDLNKIVLQYHIKIKILKEGGKKYADYEIAMQKRGSSRQEDIKNIRASSFNRVGSTWKESVVQGKNIFVENFNKEVSFTKFAIPDVRVGSVIEIYYQFETPFTYNFVPWKFQSEIPKVKSEFWAKYPGYYQYNAALKGFLTLTKNQNEIVSRCIIRGSGLQESGADCSLSKYGMTNIPAFKEEDYMTSKYNFISAISFELTQVAQMDGRVNKITKDWKDVEQELRLHESFGAQIKKARNILGSKVNELKLVEKDRLSLASNIHDHIKESYTWNGNFSCFTDNGVKKTAETKQGNVADINLSLLGALQEADFEAEPVLISTRSNGLPIKLYPVLSDFNYVLVRLKVGEQYYLLDATHSLYPFGFIPECCLNGQGRLVGKTSGWIDIKPTDKESTRVALKMQMTDDGTFNGNGTIEHGGYAAYKSRNFYLGFSKMEDFVQKRLSAWSDIEIRNFTVENDAEITKPFIEKFETTYSGQAGGNDIIYIQPILIDRLDKNPFTSSERLYPVDYGAPVEHFFTLILQYPNDYTLEEVPRKIAVDLPLDGGSYVFDITQEDNKVSISSSLKINRSVYNSREYRYLKDLYNGYLEAQQTQIVFKKKK